MAKGYRFDDRAPWRGRSYNAFRTLRDCQRFVRLQGGLSRGLKIYELDGAMVKDEGGPDGLVMKVSDYKIIEG